MHESDTYLAIIDEGQMKFAREVILLVGGDRLGPPEEWVKPKLNSVLDQDRLTRIVRGITNAATWQGIFDTPEAEPCTDPIVVIWR